MKPNNLRVAVDDDVVGEIPDGQDILAQHTEISAQFSSDGRDDTEGYNNGYEAHLVFQTRFLHIQSISLLLYLVHLQEMSHRKAAKLFLPCRYSWPLRTLLLLSRWASY